MQSKQKPSNFVDVFNFGWLHVTFKISNYILLRLMPIFYLPASLHNKCYLASSIVQWIKLFWKITLGLIKGNNCRYFVMHIYVFLLQHNLKKDELLDQHSGTHSGEYSPSHQSLFSPVFGSFPWSVQPFPRKQIWK